MAHEEQEPRVNQGGSRETKKLQREQKIAILKEAEAGIPAANVCRKHGIAGATFYDWKRAYAGMEVSDAKKLKALKEENRRLKSMVADLALDNRLAQSTLALT